MFLKFALVVLSFNEFSKVADSNDEIFFKNLGSFSQLSLQKCLIIFQLECIFSSSKQTNEAIFCINVHENFVDEFSASL